MYTFGEAWFLTTLLLNKEWSSLQQVIATGDVINHAIFTPDEINGALSKFILMGYIEMDDSKNLRATSKAIELCNKSFLNAGLFSKADKILTQLNKSVNFNHSEIIEYFSDHEINKAYKKYAGVIKHGKNNK